MIGPKVAPPSRREEADAYEAVDLRDSGVCVLRAADCEGPVQRDHRQNRSQGGLTVLENLHLLCLRHHDWKTTHPAQACSEGYGVPGWADPATYPGRRVTTRYGRPRTVWCIYRPTLDEPHIGWVEITRREAARRIAEGRLYQEVSA